MTQPTTADPAVALLLEAGIVLASSLEPDVTMHQVAELMVPQLADLCVIDLLDGDGLIRDVAVVARDPGVAERLEHLRRESPIDPAGGHPVARVLRTGRPELLSHMTPGLLETFAEDDEHARFMVDSHYHSAIVAPLRARDRTLGMLSVLRLGESDPYDAADFELACDLARRAALAIDNARLFAELRAVEQRLEAILGSVAEAITVVDDSGRTIYANQAASDLLDVGCPDELTDGEPGSVMRRFQVLDESGEELDLDRMPARLLFRGEPVEPLLVRNIVRRTGEERWLNVRCAGITDPETGAVRYAVNVFENITEVKRAEQATRFLAEASRVLASSLDFHHTLSAIAHLAVPAVADWCVIDVAQDDGGLARVAIAHRDSARVELAPTPRAARTARDEEGIGEVIRTGRPLVISEITAERLAEYARDDDHLALLQAIDPRALVIVPMLAGAKRLGAISLVWSDTPRRLDPSDLALAEELGRRTGAAVDSARSVTERTRIAEILQRALLPAYLPSIPFAQIAARYAASGERNEVGGDFYDVFEYDTERWMLVIGDVCGKGPRSASVTALARHTLRAAAMNGSAPKRMLEMLHSALLRDPGGDVCTVCLVLVAPTSEGAQLTVTLAGHPPPLLLGPRGAPRPVGELGTLLGLIDPVVVCETVLSMGRDDTLLLYTDGVTEARGQAGLLGEEGLQRLLQDGRAMALEELLAHIEHSAVAQADGRAQDDIALLALRLGAAQPRDVS